MESVTGLNAPVLTPGGSRTFGIHVSMSLSSSEVAFHPSSFADRNGRLFFWEGELYRGIYAESAGFYQRVLTLPLIKDLCDRGLLVSTEVSDVALEDCPLALRHATVPFVSYPFEWCGAMLRDAAFLVLDMMEALATQGLCLRSPSPWDVLFAGPHPVFVDFTAIGPIEADLLWRDYDKFRRTFLFPLRLMSGRRERVARWLLHDYVHGVSPGDFARMSPHTFVAMKVRQTLNRMSAIAERLHSGPPISRSTSDLGSEDWAQPRPRDLSSHRGALRLLRREIETTRLQPRTTIWSDYYQEHADITFPAFSPSPDWYPKHQSVYDILRELRPTTVNSFGCNRAWYEQQAALLGAHVVCSDVDVIAISQLYSDARDKDLSLVPLILDVLNPSPGLGLNNRRHPPASERLRCDLVMALALTHHLILDHGLSIEQVVASLSAFADRWLLIEFVPPNDAFLSGWCPDPPSWYAQDHFEAALDKSHRSVTSFPSYPSPRVLFLCER